MLSQSHICTAPFGLRKQGESSATSFAGTSGETCYISAWFFIQMDGFLGGYVRKTKQENRLAMGTALRCVDCVTRMFTMILVHTRLAPHGIFVTTLRSTNSAICGKAWTEHAGLFKDTSSQEGPPASASHLELSPIAHPVSCGRLRIAVFFPSQLPLSPPFPYHSESTILPNSG